MRHKFVRILGLAMVLLLAACGGGGGGNDGDPGPLGGPGGGGTGDTMSFAIDGGGTVTRTETEDPTTVDGYDPMVDSMTNSGATIIYMVAQFNSGTSYYDEGVTLYVDGQAVGDYPITGTNFLQYTNNPTAYIAAEGFGTSSGTISITRYDASRIVGTFNVSAVDMSDMTTMHQVTGSFDLEPGISAMP